MKKLKYAKYSGNAENCEDSVETSSPDLASSQSPPDNHNGNGHSVENLPQNEIKPENEHGLAISSQSQQPSNEPGTDKATTSQESFVPQTTLPAMSPLDARRAELRNKFSDFIESLAMRSSAAMNKNPVEVNANQPQAGIDRNMRPTSELLSRLQEALSLPIPRPVVEQPHTPPVPTEITLKPDQKLVNMTIRIERAKYDSSATDIIKSAALRSDEHGAIAPSTYCSFEALPRIESNDSNKIHRLTTFRTKSKTLSSEPDWDEEFELCLVDNVNDVSLPLRCVSHSRSSIYDFLILFFICRKNCRLLFKFGMLAEMHKKIRLFLVLRLLTSERFSEIRHRHAVCIQ